MEQWNFTPTARQKREIMKPFQRNRNPMTFRDSSARAFVGDKFGESTTHWRKLEDRMHRGVGNPCPLVFIGIPASVVTFHEGKAALAEIVAAEGTDAGD